MSGELSSDATPLAKGCECESFGSPDPGPGVGEGYVWLRHPSICEYSIL